jgi:nicotinate dehydrogenase subunit B
MPEIEIPELEVERYELHAGPAYRFTPDRRDFFKLLGGGLLVLLALGSESAEAQESGGGRRDRIAMPQELGAWLHISEAGAITVYTGKAEMGQNIRTSLTQAVAEELHAAPADIHLVMGDTALTPYDRGTFGSMTTPTMAPQLRKVSAAAREMLLDLAASQWKRERGSLTVENGRVLDRSSNSSLSFGELTKGQTLTKTITPDIRLTPAADWKIAGRDMRKIGGESFVTGKEKYTSDLKLPAMMHGRVLRPSAFGAQPVSVETGAARGMAGVVAVQDADFIGVACEDPSHLDQAAAAVKVEWKSKPQPGSRELFDYLKAHAGNPVDWKPIESHVHAEASYTVAYIAHTPLEPRAAVAQWENGGLTVWTGSQCPFRVRSELAQSFGIPEEKVRVIIPATGAAYGGKHTGECAVEAARLAKAAGRPVKLQWTREEEFTWAYFRPAGLIEVRSGANADGTIASWQFHNYNSGNAAIQSPYNIPGQVAEFHASDSPLRQGSYRGLAASANHFARESHMDELAHAAGMEPAAFRMKNASDPRLRGVIEAATERFRWGRAKSRRGQGFGMMAGFDKGGYVSACVEITVTAGVIRIDRVVQAFDCGAVVNPDQLKNQIVGGTMMGLGGALSEAIEFENGRILNPKLSKYRVPRFNDMPEIDVVLVDRKDITSAGAGETPIVAIAPAVANAVFDSTGKRIRSMPIRLS